MQWCNFYFQGVELHVLLNKPLQLFFMPSGIWFIYRPSYYLVNFGVPLCSRPLSIHVTLAWWFVQQGFKEFVPNHNIALFLVGRLQILCLHWREQWCIPIQLVSNRNSQVTVHWFLVWQSGCYYNFEFNWCQNWGKNANIKICMLLGFCLVSFD